MATLTLVDNDREIENLELDDFHLTFPRTEIDSASVEVNWCLQPQGHAALKAAQVRKPQLLIVTCTLMGDHEQRFLFPLEDGRAYLPLHHAELTHVFAAIVWGVGKDFPKEKYLSVYVTNYRQKIWNENLLTNEIGMRPTTRFVEQRGVSRLGLTHRLLRVPDGIFAQKPWDWNWTNLMFSEPPRDQCQFRRRRFWSFTGQVPTILFACTFISTFWLSIWLVLKLLGLRGVRPLILNPKRQFFEEAPWTGMESFDSDFTYRFKNGRRFWPGLALSPVLWFPVAWVWMRTTDNDWNTFGWFVAHSIFEIGKNITVLWAVFFVLDMFFTFLQLRSEGRLQLPGQKVWYDDQATVEQLVCPAPSENGALARKRRTITLIYQDLKHLVCKPFAA